LTRTIALAFRVPNSQTKCKSPPLLHLPEQVKIHPVVHVIHTTPFVSQPPDIAQVLPPKPDPVPMQDEEEFVVEKVLNHRKRGKGYQWLTLMKGEPTHEATWLPTRNVMDEDGTLTEKFHEYIVSNDILKHLH